jgi:hypothetical protein
MRVGPSVWGPPSCEGLLCWCCKFNIFQRLIGSRLSRLTWVMKLPRFDFFKGKKKKDQTFRSY